MDRIKRYIDCYIPTETCNLRCHYCYITQKRKFNNKIATFDFKPEYITKALSKKRLGGTCLFNICAGGETLLSEDVIEITKSLLQEGHYVMIVTNGTLTKRFNKISEFPKEYFDRLFFKFSFHYLELKRLKMLDTFFENVNLMKRLGASIVVEITPNDELEPYVQEILELSRKYLGTLPHLTIGRKDDNDIPILTKHSKEEYYNIWKCFDSEMFKYKYEVFGKKRKEFCYAGDWSVYLNLGTGELKQCYCGLIIDNIYRNLDKPINFLAIGNNCTLPHCYNAHVFLTLGTIPELDSPTYDIMRNRMCNDGTEWVTGKMQSFLKSKLKDSNDVLNDEEKSKINKLNRKMKKRIDIKNKIRNFLGEK